MFERAGARTFSIIDIASRALVQTALRRLSKAPDRAEARFLKASLQ